MNRPPRIAIVGAGVSGLAAAHRLTELSRERGVPLEVLLFDGAARAGGVISTVRRDGFLWEEGPDSFITEKPWALDLCRRLGLADRLIGTNPDHPRSFVAFRNRLHPTPEGFYLLAPSRFWPMAVTPLFSWAGKLRMAMDLFLPPRRDGADESLAAFVRRRFGREALERMAQPMVAGVYAADPGTLSLKATFPRFLEMESMHGSVIRALWRQRRAGAGRAEGIASGPRYGLFVTLRDGLDTLVEALVRRLPPGALRLKMSVESLRREDDAWRLALAGGASESVDAVCLALPAPKTAALAAGADLELAALLGSIPYGSSATLHLAFRREDVAHPLDGFGFVVPAVENLCFLGCTFGSVKFPGRAPDGRVLLRVFIGGPPSAERASLATGRPSAAAALALDDAALTARVLAELRPLLGLRAAPLFASTRRFDAAMAHYTLGHLDRVAAVEARARSLPGFALAGNGTRGIGLPDCVRSGEEAAVALFDRLTTGAEAARA